ncbi:MAG: GTPase [Candidatus Marsarchaeota archaeon]|jgi:predicted GTPase|nr:GTPase [Candidatus Marsarchaeota archaeon]
MGKTKVVIIGAAGRDFHTFNVLFRDNAEYDVVAFTAAQIPFISGRMYPKELSGKRYPKGIPIYDESELPGLVRRLGVDVCIMAYSDLRYQDVMEKASLCNSIGADFWLVAPERAMIRSKKPVIAVCGVRTGVGKSQTSRYVALLLRKMGVRVAIIRHPMPYGILKDEIAERFATLKDLDRYKTTVEEREDYEPHIRNGFVVFAGVDYEAVLKMAEKEADVILWDGGNNDSSFIRPDLLVVVADPLRAGNELTYYPGETVARMADILLINKVNSASKAETERVVEDLLMINSRAVIVRADSLVNVDNPAGIRGKSALIVEDGPTITHGGMLFGAGTVAARQYGVGRVVNAKRYAQGTLKAVFEKYKHLSNELPAVGYSPKQIRDLENTINAADCDVVISATPINLRSVINVNKPIVQVSYELRPLGRRFDAVITKFVKERVGATVNGP